MKRIQFISLSILAGLLLGFSWPDVGDLTFLIFFAFIPLLWVADQFALGSAIKYPFLFLCSFLAFLTWNLMTVWWVKNASIESGILAVLCNTVFMSGAFHIYALSVRRIQNVNKIFLFIPFWLSFEYLHMHWDLTFPWLTLGNVFAKNVGWIQWYEYTGVFGGSLWVLMVNVLIFQIVKHIIKQSGKRKIFNKVLQVIVVLILFPILLDLSVFSLPDQDPRSCRAVIVQPNIDPYTEKFSGDYMEQVEKMFALAAEKVDSTTDLLVLPETALQENIWENDMSQSMSIQYIQKFNQRFPKLNILIGANSIRKYEQNEKHSSTAHLSAYDSLYYDEYNTALQLDNSGKIQVYHKSKLVPGVEMMPFPWLLGMLGDVAIKLGGTNTSYGTQTERSVFVSTDQKIKAAPVICYESIYGEYVNEYIKNGANLICIITNDGWWGDTPGCRQHLNYARLRCIETRRSIVRSANTGISCFIDKEGNVSQPTAWWETAVISQNVELNYETTFYVKYGDYIAKLAVFLFSLTVLYAFYLRFFAKKQAERPFQ